jgi:hypothetical protein
MIVVGLALLAGASAWLVGEATFDHFRPSEAAAAQSINFRALNEEQSRANIYNGALAFGALGGLLGLALGVGGGLARRSPVAAIRGAVVGLALGAAAGALPAWAVMPYEWGHRAVDHASLDLLPPLLIHLGLWSAIGLAAGAAFGVGADDFKATRLFEAALAGLVGAMAGTFVFEVAGAILFPMARTAQPFAATPGARLLARLCVAGFVGLGTWASSRPGRRRSRSLASPDPSATGGGPLFGRGPALSSRRSAVLLLLIIAAAGMAIARQELRRSGAREAMLGSDLTRSGFSDTPDGRYQAILTEAREADGRVSEAIREAPQEGKGAELLRRREVWRTFADRFLALARDGAADPAAGIAVVDALTWVITHCPDDPQGREAVERLSRGPIDSDRMAQACQELDVQESPIAEPIFRAVLRSNPHGSARAQATLALARALRRRSERGAPGRGELARAADLVREARALYEDAIARYGEEHIGREALAEVARAELFELRSLGVGREAPEIEGPDLQGRPMRLSAFRGKVVLLEFWGFW